MEQSRIAILETIGANWSEGNSYVKTATCKFLIWSESWSTLERGHWSEPPKNTPRSNSFLEQTDPLNTHQITYSHFVRVHSAASSMMFMRPPSFVMYPFAVSQSIARPTSRPRWSFLGFPFAPGVAS